MKNDGTLVRYLKNMKGKWTLLLLGVAGVILLLFGSLGGNATKAGESIGAEDYRAALTAEVTLLVSEVRGAGEVTVLLTLESGESRIYAENSTGGTVTVGGDGLLVESRPPRVVGVAVVCTGGDDPAVRTEISDLLAASLGVGAHRIKISAKK